jgi:hypothetical protein
MRILTANRLIDGIAVWYAGEAGWSEDFDQAEVARDAETEARLEAVGKAGLASNLVVDVDLIDVVEDNGRFRPVRLRERIRAAGPTNRTDLGKQARAAAGGRGDR